MKSDVETSGTYVPVTKADAALPNGLCLSLVCGSGGTVNLMDEGGQIRTNFPLQTGYNPIRALQVRTGGTATDIWAMF